MKARYGLLATIGAAALGVGAMQAKADETIVIDFDGLSISDGQTMPAGHGSVDDVLDVAWDSGFRLNNEWNDSNLSNVTYMFGAGTSTNEVTFTALGDWLITLDSFDAGYWGSGANSLSWRVLDGPGGSELHPGGSLNVTSDTTFTPDVGPASVLTLELTSANNVAFDNFTLTAIPEPASLGLVTLLGAGLMRRRRA